jgi:hypothetical protein
MAATATRSLKISAQALKVLLELTIRRRRSYLELIRAKKRPLGLGVEGDVADLVHDEQRDPRQALKLVVEAPGALGGAEAVDPLVRGGEGHQLDAPRGGHAERDRQVRLGGWAARGR